MSCCALCGSVTGEDRWPVSAPLAEGAQPWAGERTLDKRGGSKSKRRWEFPVWDRRRNDKVGKWYWKKMEVDESSGQWENSIQTAMCDVSFTFGLTADYSLTYFPLKPSFCLSFFFFFSFLRSKCSTMSSLIKHRFSTSLAWVSALLCTE